MLVMESWYYKVYGYMCIYNNNKYVFILNFRFKFNLDYIF